MEVLLALKVSLVYLELLESKEIEDHQVNTKHSNKKDKKSQFLKFTLDTDKVNI